MSESYAGLMRGPQGETTEAGRRAPGTRMRLSDAEVYEVTGLTGYRTINHRMRKGILIDRVRAHLPAGAEIADIGCGAGDIAMELQALGFRMTAVDHEPIRVELGRAMASHHGLDVNFIAGDLTEVELDKKFDGLIMGEILEHFSCPREVLEAHLALVKPGGKVFITVPNMASLRARLKLLFFGQFADHNPEHKFYFTKRRFVEHFEPSKVEVEEISSHLNELTFIRNRLWARMERLALKPMRWISPWSGSHLVAVLRKQG